MVLLPAIFDRVLPVVPPPMVPALTPYTVLFEELLLRGSDDRVADAGRLARELDDPDTLAFVEHEVIGWEFGRIVKTIGDDGPGRLRVALTTIWPPMRPWQAATVMGLATASKAALGEILQAKSAGWLRQELGKIWHLPDEPQERRGRGRPRDRATESLLAMGAREGMFDDRARPYAVAAAISARPDSKLSHASAYRRLNVARETGHIPELWRQTLWHERVQPLHVEHFRVRRVAGRIRKITLGD